jgi:hypothetical protein
MIQNNNKLVFHKLIAEIGGSFLEKTSESNVEENRTISK